MPFKLFNPQLLQPKTNGEQSWHSLLLLFKKYTSLQELQRNFLEPSAETELLHNLYKNQLVSKKYPSEHFEQDRIFVSLL